MEGKDKMRTDFKLTQALLGMLATAFFAWAGVVWNMNQTLEEAFNKYQIETVEKFGEVGAAIAEQSIMIRHMTEELRRHDSR